MSEAKWMGFFFSNHFGLNLLLTILRFGDEILTVLHLITALNIVSLSMNNIKWKELLFVKILVQNTFFTLCTHPTICIRNSGRTIFSVLTVIKRHLNNVGNSAPTFYNTTLVNHYIKSCHLSASALKKNPMAADKIWEEQPPIWVFEAFFLFKSGNLIQLDFNLK